MSSVIRVTNRTDANETYRYERVEDVSVDGGVAVIWQATGTLSRRKPSREFPIRDFRIIKTDSRGEHELRRGGGWVDV
jgi:hypothetical protein